MKSLHHIFNTSKAGTNQLSQFHPAPSQSSALTGLGGFCGGKEQKCPLGKQQLLHHPPLIWNLGCSGTWALLWVLGFPFPSWDSEAGAATGGADFQMFHCHGGPAVLQAEENSLSFFLFFSRTSQILAFGVPQENPDPRHQHGSSRCCWGCSNPPGRLEGDVKTSQKLPTPPGSQLSLLDSIPADSWSRFLVIQAENTKGRVT